MSPHDSLEIITAALRWHAAYDRRRAAAADKRLADQAYRNAAMPFMSGALGRAVDASRRVTEAKRQERAAQRALAKACARLRGDQLDADVIEMGALEFQP